MSDSDNKHKAVWNWIYQNEQILSLFFNFSTTENKDTVIAPVVSDNIIKQYVDGTAVRQYDFGIVQYRTFNQVVPNNDENTEIIFDVEEIMSWIKAQNSAKNYPQFPDNCTILKVENLQDMPSVSGINETNAQYMFTVRITYIERD